MTDPLAELLLEHIYHPMGRRCACGAQFEDTHEAMAGHIADRLRAAGVTVGDAGLDAALGKYVLHSLDGHDECGPDCEIGALRLALPDAAYAATISHGDIEAALVAPAPPRIDPEVLARAVNSSGEWPMVQGIDGTSAAAIIAAYEASANEHDCPWCGDAHITYCRTCGKTRMVEWLHRDCADEGSAT